MAPSSHDPSEGEKHAISGEVVNASGHKQELRRHFSLLNICGIAVTTGNSWTAIGGSVVRSSSTGLAGTSADSEG